MIGLDFETYGSRNLPKVGLQNYVDDPLFRPLVASMHAGNGNTEEIDFVLDDYQQGIDKLEELADSGELIVAHNAGFERAVLKRLGFNLPAKRFLDSAVVAAYHGAGRSLEAAASQLLLSPKYARGAELIKIFCIPGKYQEGANSKAFQEQIAHDLMDDWADLMHYCNIDAKLSLQMVSWWLPVPEWQFTDMTLDMNEVGWPIDIALVKEMQARYEANLVTVEAEFAASIDGPVPNLASTTQLKKWCAERGVRSSSFDEDRVEAMLAMMDKRLSSTTVTPEKKAGYLEVQAMLLAKRELGGSSLKKLEVMLRQTAGDGRLHDSYLHFGAQATGRTTGRGVQMQNLPRLHGAGDDVDELHDPSVHWDNRKLAANLRQVFCASEPGGQLVVGDFSSVESRGLAWQAGEEWKLDAYRSGHDLYKVLAGRIYGVEYGDVSKDQRQVGKTGELSCGYGAGAGAVHAFAKNMGVTMSEPEAAALVRDWRDANPAIVDWWATLHTGLLNALEMDDAYEIPTSWGKVLIVRVPAPMSLQELGPKHSLMVELKARELEFVRYIHGVQLEGRNMTYWKPSERKTGALWSKQFTDPKTKRLRDYTVYGGKLAGLLTQSLCREMFFQSLRSLENMLTYEPNVRIVGQFHDEIVVEWLPGGAGHNLSLSTTIARMELAMTDTPLPGFPLAAEIKHAYRYIK